MSMIPRHARPAGAVDVLELSALVLAVVAAVAALVVATITGPVALASTLALATMPLVFVLARRRSTGQHLPHGGHSTPEPAAPWRGQCRYCGEELRRDGLTLVGVVDDVAACSAAPLVGCSYCDGGCGQCEGYGETYGPHALDDEDGAQR